MLYVGTVVVDRGRTVPSMSIIKGAVYVLFWRRNPISSEFMRTVSPLTGESKAIRLATYLGSRRLPMLL